MTWYSERKHYQKTLTAGGTTATSAALDMGNFAGAAVLMPAGFAATLSLQASHDGTNWAFCRNSNGQRIEYGSGNAGSWITLDAAIYPHGLIRLALTDGNGTLAAGSTAYTFHLSLKS